MMYWVVRNHNGTFIYKHVDVKKARTHARHYANATGNPVRVDQEYIATK